MVYIDSIDQVSSSSFCVHSGGELLHGERENGRRRHDQARGPGVVPVRGHGGTVRVPEAEDPLSRARRDAGRAAVSPDRPGRHRVRPDHHVGAAGHRRQQRQQARVSRQAHDRRVSRARRGRRRFAQAPGTGQGERDARACVLSSCRIFIAASCVSARLYILNSSGQDLVQAILRRFAPLKHLAPPPPHLPCSLPDFRSRPTEV